MDEFFFTMRSDDIGRPPSWMAARGSVPNEAVLSILAEMLATESLRTGRDGELAMAFARTDMNVWVAVAFHVHGADGGTSVLFDLALTEALCAPVDFPFNLDHDPGAQALFSISLEDPDAFAHLLGALGGGRSAP